MYLKLVIFVVVVILAGFLYLHTQNPGEVNFHVYNTLGFTTPATFVLFLGFIAGVVLTVANSLVLDALKGIKGFKSRRALRRLSEAQENYRKGAGFLATGDIRSARKFLERAVATLPDDAGMVIALSETYVREGRGAEALEVLEEGALKGPASVGIHLAVARAAIDAGDMFRATKALNDVLRIDPGNPYALERLRELKIAEGAWSDAADLTRKIIDGLRSDDAIRDERRRLSIYLYEQAKFHAGEDRSSVALSFVKDSLRNNSTFMPADILHGAILYRDGRPAEAVTVLEQALGKYKGAYALMLKIEDIYIKKSAPEKAIERYRKEIYTHPADRRLKQLLGRLFLRLEMVIPAVEALERVYNEEPEDQYTLVLLAEAYLKKGEGERAAMLFEKALNLHRDLLPPFICDCGARTLEWSDRCASCGQWNTVDMAGGIEPESRVEAAATVGISGKGQTAVAPGADVPVLGP